MLQSSVILLRFFVYFLRADFCFAMTFFRIKLSYWLIHTLLGSYKLTYCDLLATVEPLSASKLHLETNIYFSSCLCFDKWLSLPTQKSICTHTLSQLTLCAIRAYCQQMLTWTCTSGILVRPVRTLSATS